MLLPLPLSPLCLLVTRLLVGLGDYLCLGVLCCVGLANFLMYSRIGGAQLNGEFEAFGWDCVFVSQSQ